MFDLTGKITPRENYLRIIKGGEPEYLCHNNEYSNGPVYVDPMAAYYAKREVGISQDPWGVSYIWLPGTKAANPYVTEENKVIKDIRRWDFYLKDVPSPSSLKLDWTEAEERAKNFDRKTYIFLGACFTGLFELTHNLMGFEDALCNYLEEPEAMGELLDYLCEFKLEYLKILIDHTHPDMIHIHDDWGNKRSLFMAPAVWRKLLKPRWARIYAYMHERGVMVQHHADCVCAPIVEDMAEIGIDVWQGIIPQNDIPDVQRRLNGRMALQGGIDGVVFDHENWTIEEVRGEIRRACDEYVPAGYFQPAMGNNIPLTPGLYEVVIDEMNAYGEHFFERLRK